MPLFTYTYCVTGGQAVLFETKADTVPSWGVCMSVGMVQLVGKWISMVLLPLETRRHAGAGGARFSSLTRRPR